MKGKRFLSLLLCLIMVLSCLPISVFATFLELDTTRTYSITTGMQKYTVYIRVYSKDDDQQITGYTGLQAGYWEYKSKKITYRSANAINLNNVFLKAGKPAMRLKNMVIL